MSGVNRVILVGNIGRDPECRYTKSGQAVASFSLATSEKYKGETKTEWHRITAWGKLAEIVTEYLKKGSQVYIEGRLQTREWEQDGSKRQTTEIVASQMTMLGSSSNNSNNSKADYDDSDIPWGNQ